MNWNYGDILDAVARAVPADRAALMWQDQVVSWSQFDRRSNNLAKGLIDLGHVSADRAAVLCRNHPAYIEAMAASAKARLLMVNINYRYTPEEIAYVINDCDAAVFIYQDVFEETVQILRMRPSTIRTWIRIETVREPERALDGILSFETLARSGDGSPLDIRRSPDDGYLLYTGGTTGQPKGVLWPTSQSRRVQLESPLVTKVPESMAEHAAMVAGNLAPSRTIPACPLMHGAGSNAAMGDLLNGGSAVILPSDRFDPDELWREVARHQVSRIVVVGDVFAKPMLQALDDQPGRYDLSSVKVITSAGLIWTAEVKEGLIRHMPDLICADHLGASEAGGFGFAIATRDRVPPTGLFDAGVHTVLVDAETGEILPKDKPVEGFLARSGAMAAGYYRDEAQTAATYRTIDGVRYAIPGDFARWVPPNQFMLIGRGNLSINTGGEKVFPEEVEEALKLLPDVEDALVVGQPDDRWGKIVVALVRSTKDLDETLVRRFLSERLAAYKHPKRIVRVPEVPRHASGKADYRRALALASGETAAH